MAISLREFTDINPPMFQDKEAPTEVAVDQAPVIPTQPKVSTGMTGEAGKYLKEMEPFLEAERKAQADKDIFASELKAQELSSQAKKSERMADVTRTQKSSIEGSQAFQDLKEAEDELMKKGEFIPTQDTAKDLGGLFSLIGVIGFAIGGAGKENAIQAMSAMNGMLSGYQKGRADLYKREKDIFDTNMKALQIKTTILSNRLKQVAELYALDAKAGDQEADALFNEEQATFYKQYKDKFGLPATLELHKRNTEAFKDAKNYELKLKEMAAKKREEVKLAASQKNMNQRVINALGGISSIGEVIQMVPAGSTTGILPNLQTKDGMYNFIRNFATRQLSGDEAQALEVLYSGVARNLAAIEASGAATGLVGLATQMAKLEPKAGESAYTTALKIADMRRIATEMTRPLINSGLLDPKQEQEAIRLVNLVEKTIPYTVQDVISANPKFANRKTIGEKSQEIVNKGTVKASFATEAEANEAFKQGRIKVGDRVKVGNQIGIWEK